MNGSSISTATANGTLRTCGPSWATKRIGVVPGVLTLERRDDGARRMITWTGFQPAAVGSLSVTLLAGADATDFTRDETLLGAIVDSVRFD